MGYHAERKTLGTIKAQGVTECSWPPRQATGNSAPPAPYEQNRENFFVSFSFVKLIISEGWGLPLFSLDLNLCL